MSELRWTLTREEQEHYIDLLTAELAPLRTRVGISQGEIAYLIGVSRQTYSAIELKKKRMSWNTYLSLIFFFDSSTASHEELHNKGIYPERMVMRFNEGRNTSLGSTSAQAEKINSILAQLDDQARHTVKTTIMVEYARCKKLPGDAVIRAFDGTDYSGSLIGDEWKRKTDEAIRNLKSND